MTWFFRVVKNSYLYVVYIHQKTGQIGLLVENLSNDKKIPDKLKINASFDQFSKTGTARPSQYIIMLAYSLYRASSFYVITNFT